MLLGNTEEVIERESLERTLQTGRKLRVKLGIDPTAPDIHLGFAVVLHKLREFQDAGHTIVFIIGDYTARIGDPSGKTKTRPPLTRQEVKKNAVTYVRQVGKIVDMKKAEIRYNSEWFSKMKLEEFIHLAAHFSTQRILDREDFRRRLSRGQEVMHHETLYQIMQAYDSVVTKADVEIGGRDQKLNMLAGRELQRKLGGPEQNIITMPILIGLDGKEKMSKSLGNYIGIAESPRDMFGKIMSLPDTLMLSYFALVLGFYDEALQRVRERLESENPRDVKLDLAEGVVALYHGKSNAKKTRKNFIDLFSRHETADIPTRRFPPGPHDPVDALVQLGLVSSRSEARRLLKQGAVEIDGAVARDPRRAVSIRIGSVLRVGKKTFIKII